MFKPHVLPHRDFGENEIEYLTTESIAVRTSSLWVAVLSCCYCSSKFSKNTFRFTFQKGPSSMTCILVCFQYLPIAAVCLDTTSLSKYQHGYSVPPRSPICESSLSHYPKLCKIVGHLGNFPAMQIILLFSSLQDCFDNIYYIEIEVLHMLGVNFIYLHVACRNLSISNKAFYQKK